jgi:hypothetical protein
LHSRFGRRILVVCRVYGQKLCDGSAWLEKVIEVRPSTERQVSLLSTYDGLTLMTMSSLSGLEQIASVKVPPRSIAILARLVTDMVMQSTSVCNGKIDWREDTALQYYVDSRV